jgi:hypothetical protein
MKRFIPAALLALVACGRSDGKESKPAAWDPTGFWTGHVVLVLYDTSGKEYGTADWRAHYAVEAAGKPGSFRLLEGNGNGFSCDGTTTYTDKALTFTPTACKVQSSVGTFPSCQIKTGPPVQFTLVMEGDLHRLEMAPFTVEYDRASDACKNDTGATANLDGSMKVVANGRFVH